VGRKQVSIRRREVNPCGVLLLLAGVSLYNRQIPCYVGSHDFLTVPTLLSITAEVHSDASALTSQVKFNTTLWSIDQIAQDATRQRRTRNEDDYAVLKVLPRRRTTCSTDL